MHNTTLMRLFTKPYIRWEKSAQLPIKPQQPKQPREKKRKNIELKLFWHKTMFPLFSQKEKFLLEKFNALFCFVRKVS